MKKTSSIGGVVVLLGATLCVMAQTSAHWPQWRGPFFNGMARGDAPTVWSDTKNIKWKTEIPGRGHASRASIRRARSRSQDRQSYPAAHG